MSHRAVVTLVLVASLGAFTACNSTSDKPTPISSSELTVDTPAAAEEIDHVNWAVEGEPTTLDPIFAYNYFDDGLLANMCEAPMRYESDLTLVPWLATPEQVDPTTLVLSVREGVTFWDGSPMTAEDVAFSLNRNLDPELGSYFVDGFTNVTSIEATAPYEVTVKFSAPDVLFAQGLGLAGSYIISKKYATEKGSSFGTPSGGLMCTGPYELKSFQRGEPLTMTRNPDYWNEELRPKAEEFTFSFLEDATAQAQALASGELDGMYVRDPGIIPKLNSSDGNIYYGRGFFVQYLIPTLKQGPLQDPKIRQALSQAIDRPGIAETVFHGAAEPMRTLVGPAEWPSDEAAKAVYEKAWDSFPTPAPDIAAGKSLVESAGSPTASITIGTVAGGYQQAAAEAIQDAGRRIGLNIELRTMSGNAYLNLLYDPQALADAGLDAVSVQFDISVLDPLGLYLILDPKVASPYNYSGYSNPDVTRSLRAADQELDPVARAEDVVAAQETVMKDLPLIPIVAPHTILYMGKGITGAPATASQLWSGWAQLVGAP